VQLVIWFAVYVVLVLALAAWRNHHDSVTRARKKGHSSRGAVARQPVRGRERRNAG
jgi:hypothetical protein